MIPMLDLAISIELLYSERGYCSAIEEFEGF